MTLLTIKGHPIEINHWTLIWVGGVAVTVSYCLAKYGVEFVFERLGL